MPSPIAAWLHHQLGVPVERVATTTRSRSRTLFFWTMTRRVSVAQCFLGRWASPIVPAFLRTVVQTWHAVFRSRFTHGGSASSDPDVYYGELLTERTTRLALTSEGE